MAIRKLSASGAALLLSGIAPCVGAQDSGVTRADLPDWAVTSELMDVPDEADGAVFVRRADNQFHLTDEGSFNYTGYRIKVQHPGALALGNVSLSWDPAQGSPLVHRVNVYRDGQALDILEASEFEILRREEMLEQAMLTGRLTAILRVPDLRVGDEIEVEYTLPFIDPTFGDASFGMLFVGEEPAPGRMGLRLTWEDGQKPRVRMDDALQPLADMAAASLTISGDNLPALRAPTNAPPRYSWQRVLEFSDYADWQAVAAHLTPLFDEASRLPAGSSVQEEAERIAAAHSDPRARAEAALDLVQQEVRYVFVGLDGGNFRPASAIETWERRYGDCKGKSVLLMALLEALDIPAELVLVNNSGLDDGLDQRLPNPAMFDHILVRAVIDNEALWLDGTLPVAAPATANPFLPYRYGLPLTAGTKGLVSIDPAPKNAPDTVQLYEIDAREGTDGPARIVWTTISRGLAAIQGESQFSAMTKNQLESGLRDEFVGSGFESVESVAWVFDPDTLTGSLTVTGRNRVDWNFGDEGYVSLVLPGGGFNPPPRRQRADSQDKSAPFYSAPNYACHVTTVRLPADTDPADWDHNSRFDTKIFGSVYYRGFEKRGDTIRMVRGSKTVDEEISPDMADRDNERLSRFDNSMARISYHPDAAYGADTSNVSVPATWEIDWTQNGVPCLPEDMLSK